jgi:hypothetical protein
LYRALYFVHILLDLTFSHYPFFPPNLTAFPFPRPLGTHPQDQGNRFVRTQLPELKHAIFLHHWGALHSVVVDNGAQGDHAAGALYEQKTTAWPKTNLSGGTESLGR